MYPGNAAELAKYRMADRLSEAERYRLAKGTRSAQASEHRSTVRKVLTAAAYLVIWPIKH